MEESADAARGLERLYAAFNAKDRAAFGGCVLDQSRRLRDRHAALERRPSGLDEELRRSRCRGRRRAPRRGQIRAWADGDWAWAVDRPAFLLPGGARLPTRLTAVLARRDGEWRVVHGHFSVAVPDETAVEQAPAWLEQLGEPPGPGA